MAIEPILLDISQTESDENSIESAEQSFNTLEPNEGHESDINVSDAPIETTLLLPLISCIMPTSNRPEYVAKSVQMFMEQDYPNKELIIVFNHSSDLPSEWYGLSTADFPENIRLVQARTKILGSKRNEACRHAQGAIIAHWDDDDIYNYDRLTLQATPIVNGEADVTGLQNFVFFEALNAQSWQPSILKFKELYEGNIHGGSLVYNSVLWHHIANYSNLSLGEDAVFLKKVLKSPYNIKLMPLNGKDSFVYVRHSTNAWHIEDELFRGQDWKQVSLPRWAWDHAAFHEAMAQGAI